MLHRGLVRSPKRARGPPEAYAEALGWAVAACQDDVEAARYLDVLELHSELAETYDRLSRVEDALRHASLGWNARIPIGCWHHFWRGATWSSCGRGIAFRILLLSTRRSIERIPWVPAG